MDRESGRKWYGGRVPVRVNLSGLFIRRNILFEQTFKNIDDKLWKDAGCSSELDYVEQTSWILFLKYLDDLEKDRADAAELSGKEYTPMISKKFKWDVWAAPKTKEGKIDHNIASTGDDLIDFVNNELFPYLKKFRTTADHADTIEYKIGEIFSELKNRIQSGYNTETRRIITRTIDPLPRSEPLGYTSKNIGAFTESSLRRK